MGTRNLTAVIVNETPAIAQYGQWDGHPSGQGATVLKFCRNHLSTQEGRAAFLGKLAKCRWENGTEVDEFLRSIGCQNGWMNGNQSAKFNERFPYMTRDHGAKILDMVNDAPDDAEIVLTNSYEFAQESLSCEYAYVVDLTRNTLEAYVGFQKTPLPEGERFSGMGPNRGYYPVRLAGKWDLNDLPTQAAFEAVVDGTNSTDEGA